MMCLDAPQEIMKFPHGPLQIALSPLDAMIAAYRRLSRNTPTFQDDELDTYCNEHADFLHLCQVLHRAISPTSSSGSSDY